MISGEHTRLHNNTRNIDYFQKQTHIAEVEILPHDYYFASLGLFSNEDRPKGFSIRLEPQNELTEYVDAQVSSKEIPDGVEYFLRITNKTDATFSAEIVQL